jgi:hypothetical protein
MPEVKTELIADPVSPNTMHGWNLCRLTKHKGVLYATAEKYLPEDRRTEKWQDNHGLVFKKEPGRRWKQIAEIDDDRIYTGAVDPDGRFWWVAPRTFAFIILWKSGPDFDFSDSYRLYDGTCAYLGTGVDNEGNHLLMHAKETNHLIRFPNEMISVYYDKATDSWHRSSMVTPEGRYGYVGIILKGRKATALLKSTLFDPIAAPEPPHYNWRFLRLAKCEDLTKGEWVQQPFLLRKFGHTKMQDMIEGPDARMYLLYRHQGGDESYEATEQLPYPYYITRVEDDLSTTTVKLDFEPVAGKLYISSSGKWYVVGMQDEKLHLWRVDPGDDFKPVADMPLPGADEVLHDTGHTLRPERFGGESDGDTVHFVTIDPSRGSFGSPYAPVKLWHTWFNLPE